MNIKMVDLYGQYLGIRDEIDRAMAEVVESSSFIKGPAVEQLEFVQGFQASKTKINMLIYPIFQPNQQKALSIHSPTFKIY